MGWRYSDRNWRNEGVECRWGRQKTRFWMNIWLRCIQVYSVINRTSREVWKIKAATNNGKRWALTAASVVRCSHKTTTKCLWWARRYTPETEVKPLHPIFCCCGTELGGYFCWKLTLTRTPDPIWHTRRGPDPNRPMNGRKQGLFPTWPKLYSRLQEWKYPQIIPETVSGTPTGI